MKEILFGVKGKIDIKKATLILGVSAALS